MWFRDPNGAVIAFSDMMKKQIVMPAHLMNDGQHESSRNLFKDFSAVAQSTNTYTGQVLRPGFSRLTCKAPGRVPSTALHRDAVASAGTPYQSVDPCGTDCERKGLCQGHLKTPSLGKRREQGCSHAPPTSCRSAV